MQQEYPDLELLKHELKLAYDVLFQEPPEIDCFDWLDGESLSLFQGKRYDEIVTIIGNEADFFPFFALVSQEEGRYYLGGYLLYLIQEIAESRWFDAERGEPSFLLMAWVTTHGFLNQESTREWLTSVPALKEIVIKILDAMSNEHGFQYDQETWLEIRELRTKLAG